MSYSTGRVGKGIVGVALLTIALSGCESSGGAMDVSNLASLMSPDLSLDSLKEAIGGMEVPQLKELASGFSDLIGTEQGAVDQLKGQLDDASGGGMAGLQEKLTSSMASLEGWKEKLGVVVESLKAKGIDVSQFMSMLPA